MAAVTQIALASLLALVAGAAPAAEAHGTYHLPCAGTWFVMQGGDTPNVNDHMLVAAQAYGMDLVRTVERSPVRGADPTKQEAYWGWNEDVLAPAAGEVVEAVDQHDDLPVGRMDVEHPFGNHVVIRVAEHEFAVLAHLRRGSVAVREGQRVAPGERLGSCGNSGNTAFPHIHFHVQSRRELGTGEGLRVTVTAVDVELNGKRFAAVDWPLIRGLFVENATAKP
jgi:hypothetical protein